MHSETLEDARQRQIEDGLDDGVSAGDGPQEIVISICHGECGGLSFTVASGREASELWIGLRLCWLLQVHIINAILDACLHANSRRNPQSSKKLGRQTSPQARRKDG